MMKPRRGVPGAAFIFCEAQLPTFANTLWRTKSNKLPTGKIPPPTIDLLLSDKRFVHALFFTHLALEKILKAHWVKDNTLDVPPRTHNLIYLLENTQLQLTDAETSFLQSMNAFQIEGRYPNYRSSLHKTVRPEEAKTIIAEAKNLFQCLLVKLP